MTLSQEKVLLTVPLFGIVWLSVWGILAFPLFKRFQWRPFKVIAPEKKLILLLPLYLLAPLVVWGAIALLEQSWTEIGVILNIGSVTSLVYGLGIAIGGLSLLLLFKYSFRLFTLKTQEDTELAATSQAQKGLTILGLLLLGLWIGGIEELVFRGWIQTQLEIAFTPWLAASIGSALFALAHLVWDGRLGLWQQPGLWILGWVLVIARWANNGNLALAWGLHAGWVWGLAYIDMFLKNQPAEQQPIWLVGRPEQPLTSLLDFLLLGGTAGLIWWSFGQFS